MKDRQKKMLRLLLNQSDKIRIEELAEVFSIGKRTVSRDLDVLDHWLSLKGAKLDRKPGMGISVLTFGCQPDELHTEINKPGNYIDSLNQEVRHRLILLYLLYHPREIKIADMANSFFISDTSVWNDLNRIEQRLMGSGLSLTRHKGVGIQLIGDETAIRLEFLKIMTEIVSAGTIIPYLYNLKMDNVDSLEMNQLRFFLGKLNFPANRGILLESLSRSADELGYQFTMSGEAILYFYLQLSLHRIKTGCLINRDYPCEKPLENFAGKLLPSLVDRVFSGNLPKGEFSFLGLFMGVLETGTPPELRTLPEALVKEKNIQEFTEKMLSDFGKLDNHMYYLNEKVEAVLHLTISSMVTRLRMGIPIWHGEWGDPEASPQRDHRKRESLSLLLMEYFKISPDKEDLDYLILYFQSLFFQDNTVPTRKIRCLVCCFEGIGLASYLQSILPKELDILDVVESTAFFKIRQDYLESKNIELVLSTFPLIGITTPVINITLPLDKSKLIEAITHALCKMDFSKRRKVRSPEHPPSSIIPFERIISFIGGFSLLTLEFSHNINGIIKDLSHQLVKDKKKAKQLSGDFRKREDLGKLSFEEYEIRVLHCKSSVIDSPKAGIIDFTDRSKKRMLFLAAPDPCPEAYRILLSTITLSFMEDDRFREALSEGGLGDMRRALMDVYKEMV